MRINWVVGKKTNYFFTGLWTLNAIISFASGHYYVGILELIIAMNALTDALNGSEVTAFDFQIGRGAK